VPSAKKPKAKRKYDPSLPSRPPFRRRPKPRPPEIEPPDPSTKKPRQKKYRPAGDPKFREQKVLFVEAYKDTGDISAAMTASGLSRAQCREIVATHPELREDVLSVLDRCGVTPDAVITEMRRVALSDPATMFDERGRVLPMHKMPEDIRRAMAGMDVTSRSVGGEEGPEVTETTVRPRLWDKSGMLKELTRMLRLAAPDVVQVGNVPGEKFRSEGTDSREEIMLQMLGMIRAQKDPTEKDK